MFDKRDILKIINLYLNMVYDNSTVFGKTLRVNRKVDKHRAMKVRFIRQYKRCHG